MIIWIVPNSREGHSVKKDFSLKGLFINYVRQKGGEGGQEILMFPYEGEGGT